MDIPSDYIAQETRHKVLLGKDSANESALTNTLSYYQELSSRLFLLKQELQELSSSATGKTQRQIEEAERQRNAMWRVVPADTPPKFLCKQKNIEMRFTIVPVKEAAFRKEEEIVLQVEVWNHSRTRRIEQNLSGDPMLTGGSVRCRYVNQARGHSGILRFKLHEVSSHFEGGKVCLLIAAKLPQNSDYEELVQPFVVCDLTIRAKEVTCRKDVLRQKAHRRAS